jgi:hypothetical protein
MIHIEGAGATENKRSNGSNGLYEDLELELLQKVFNN